MSEIQVFAEYKIVPEKRQDYLEKIEQVRIAMGQIGVRDFEVYEGVDQPNLFVEMFHVPTVEAYEKMKRKRCDEQAAPGVFWKVINDCIDGGTAKLHMWAFTPVRRGDV